MNTNTLHSLGHDIAHILSLSHYSQLIRQWFARQVLQNQVERERKALAELPDELLQDIGISREQALQESRLHNVPAKRWQRVRAAWF